MEGQGGVAATAIGTLAVCIGANAAIFSVLDSVVFKPLPAPESDRIVLMYNSGGALAMQRYVENLLYGVRPMDPGVLSSGVAVLAAVALTASVLPGLRAARIDPIDALRQQGKVLIVEIESIS